MTLASINGVALHAAGETLAPEELRQRACTELLRQATIQAGLLDATDAAPVDGVASEAATQAIDALLERAVHLPEPTDEACRRHHAAHPARYRSGERVEVRHILFAVTPGVNVHALTIHAEKALLELTRKDASPGRFAQLAAELSNCPTSEQGGDLGWIGPDDCAPELANELFHQKHSQWGMGVHPRLIHTRFGFHIIEVLERRAGKQPAYAEVRERIAALLAMQSRARALHQYMSLLVGEALVEGIDLEGADSPLVQ